MNQHKPQPFYFPSSIILVDDNPSFLENISLQLDAAKLTYETCHHARQAIASIEKKPAAIHSSWLKQLLHQQEADTQQHCIIDVDISKIYSLAFDSQRFSEQSVMVVDYVMPEMDGIELCRHLNNNPIKKILITGIDDLNLAITAFNEGIIDRFIVKDDPNFLKCLIESIHEMQHLYFKSITEIITQNLLISHTECCLQDNPFINLWQNIFQRYHIIEYYLIDKTGSYLMLDWTGRKYWLVLLSETSMEEYLIIATDHHADEILLTALTQGTHLPFFITEEDQQTPVADWQRYLHPAHTIQLNHQRYYYSLIDNQDLYPLPHSILSYKNHFMRKIAKMSLPTDDAK
ncbi:MAG: response regulator [Legionellales bacterium]|nr:response regulator [Legionellales bacterium]